MEIVIPFGGIGGIHKPVASGQKYPHPMYNSVLSTYKFLGVLLYKKCLKEGWSLHHGERPGEIVLDRDRLFHKNVLPYESERTHCVWGPEASYPQGSMEEIGTVLLQEDKYVEKTYIKEGDSLKLPKK